MKLVPTLACLATLSMAISLSTAPAMGDSKVPGWIKDQAGWWAEGEITDDVFLASIEHLVSIYEISLEPTTVCDGRGSLPDGAKDAAGSWSGGQIGDDGFRAILQSLLDECAILVPALQIVGGGEQFRIGIGYEHEKGDRYGCDSENDFYNCYVNLNENLEFGGLDYNKFDTIVFVNDGAGKHTFTSYYDGDSGPGADSGTYFDSGLLEPGGTYAVPVSNLIDKLGGDDKEKWERDGHVNIHFFCQLHPWAYDHLLISRQYQ